MKAAGRRGVGGARGGRASVPRTAGSDAGGAGKRAGPRPTARAERLLDLVSFLLGAATPVSWTDLVEAFPADYGTGTVESCQRKWERDKRELLDLGIPLERVEQDEERPAGWVIDRRRYYLGDLGLTTEERTLLSVAGAAALAQPHFPLRADLAHALDKLLFREPAGASPLARRLVVHLPSRGAERKAGVLEALGRALSERRPVRIRYRSFAGEETEREVLPWGLAYRKGAWFLVAHCRLRDALRTFQVERIDSLVAEGRPGAYEIPADFDVGEVVGREPWEFAVHEPVDAELRLDPEVALLASGRFGAKATILPQPDGAAIVRLRVTYLDALVREILRLAPHAELLSPAGAREAVAAKAGAIARMHEGPPDAEGAIEVAPGADARSGSGEAIVANVERASRASAMPGHGAGFGPGAEGESGPRRAAASREPGRAPGGAAAPRPIGASELHERLRRALFLVPYAAARPGCPLKELAAAVRLGEEELLAELDFLRMVGKPPFSPADLLDIDVFDGRVHVALPQGLLEPPSLTPLEAAALDAAATALAAEGGAALERARGKLRAAVSPAVRERFDRIAGRVVLDHGSLPPEVASLVDRAIARKRELELTYWTAGRGEATRRVVRPLERVLHQGYWYLYAFCTKKRDRRLFRLDRAADLVLLDRTFVPRRVDDHAAFRRDSLYDPAPDAAMARVRIEPGPWADSGLVERIGAKGVRPLGDGSLEASFPADGDAFVVSTVLSMGGSARLETPAELRERTRRAAEAAARAHRS